MSAVPVEAECSAPERINMKGSPDWHRRVKALAAEAGETLADYVDGAIRERCARDGKPKLPPRKPSVAAAG